MKKQCRRKDVATVRELLRRGIWPANVPVPDIVGANLRAEGPSS